VKFKTLKGGIPEPPINVQVEAGPQEGTLLLTWLPVTIEPVQTKHLSKLNKLFSPKGVRFRQVLLYIYLQCNLFTLRNIH
jgi:hypothetical protein